MRCSGGLHHEQGYTRSAPSRPGQSAFKPEVPHVGNGQAAPASQVERCDNALIRLSTCAPPCSLIDGSCLFTSSRKSVCLNFQDAQPEIMAGMARRVIACIRCMQLTCGARRMYAVYVCRRRSAARAKAPHPNLTCRRVRVVEESYHLLALSRVGVVRRLCVLVQGEVKLAFNVSTPA